MNEQTTFNCTISRVLFSSPTFSTYGAIVDKKDESKVTLNKWGNVALVGAVDLASGVTYEITAEESTHAKFGLQYKVHSFKRTKPRGLKECQSFLQEIISERKAIELLKHYPNIVDKVINGDLDDIDLTNIHGIKEKTFLNIKNKIISNFGLIDILEKYGGFGISMNILKKIYDKYQQINAVEKALRTSPYKALCGISGIGFKTADDIIQKLPPKLLGLDEEIVETKDRMMACMLYVLQQNEYDGHTKMDANKFRDKCFEMTPECISHFADIIKSNTDEIYFDKADVVVAKTQTYNSEKYIATKLIEIFNKSKDLKLPYQHYRTDKESGLELTDMQLQALEYGSMYSVSMLEGKAGTGKTNSMLAFVKMLEDSNITYRLLAPTGKASDRMTFLTNGRPCSTIHRCLGYERDKKTGYGKFKHDENNMFKVDYIITDEATMIDVKLFESLLKAVDPKATRLLFIQDSAQIPSVSAGNCATDILSSKIIPTTTLDKIFRYGEGGLYNVATKVWNGQMFLPKQEDKVMGVIKFGEKNDYTFIDTGNNGATDVVKLYMNLIKSGNTIDDIAVMSHHNVGKHGTAILNKLIQSKINPIDSGKCYMESGDKTFVVGDKVMQLSNNYDAKIYIGSKVNSNDLDILNGTNVSDNSESKPISDEIAIYNGNTGKIVDISNEVVIVDFGNDLLIEYEKEDLKQLDLAYAINIFKLQGSSSKITIILTPNAHTYFMNRNLLYTAITRTEKQCYHFTTQKLLNIALRKSENRDRQTFLKDLLIDESKRIDVDE